MARVSVAMATYNGQKFISEQIESILCQLGDDDELIISDDGSTDATPEIVRSYAAKDGRIKLIRGPRGGVVKNFENAIMHCSGEYIFLSDQDDKWYDGKIEKMLGYLSEYSLVCHNADIYDQQSGKITGSTQQKFGAREGVLPNILKNSFIGCCMAFKRELIKYVIPFPSEHEIHVHDWWIGLIASKYASVKFISDKLMLYRIHGNNALGMNKTSAAFKIKKRLNMIKALIKYKPHIKES